MKENHYKIIDLLKGMAIFLMLFGHVLLSVINKSNLGHESVFYITNIIINEFHMPLLFLISGVFVQQFVRKDFIPALKSKVTRLVMPYFLWSFLIACGFEALKKYADSLNIGLDLFLKSWKVPFWQFWFLYDLFFMFLIVYILGKLFKLHYKEILFSISVALYILYACQLIPNTWIFISLSRYLIYFAIGTYGLTILKNILFAEYKHSHLIISMILFLVVSYGYFIVKEYLPNYLLGYRFAVAILGCYFTAIFGKFIYNRCKICSEFLIGFGVNSMIVYCLHSSFILVIAKIWRKIFGNNLIWEQAIILTIVVSFLCWLVYEKIIPVNSRLRILFGELQRK